MPHFADSSASEPFDQATGLRRMFAGHRQRLLPLVANPFVPGSGALLECVSAALVNRGIEVLVIDAAASAPAPREWARVDLAACIEPVTDGVSFLAARGLPLAHVDTRGSAAGFIDAVAAAAPQAEVLLLHAEPTDLARMLVGRAARPVLLGADRPESIKQAYACCKLLAQRCRLMTFDLLLTARDGNRRVPHIAGTLANCADQFLGAVLLDWAAIDPLFDPAAPRNPALQRLLAAQLDLQDDPVVPAAHAAARHPTSRFGSLTLTN